MLTKKEAIMGAATELFSKKAYHMVAMDDIAKRARVAKGTLYNHFKSKEALYIALLQDGLDSLLLRLKSESGTDAAEDLRLFVSSLVTFFSERKDFSEVLKREEGRLLSKKMKNCYEKSCSIKEFLQSILNRGIAEGHFRKDLDVQTVSEIVLGMIKSLMGCTTETKKIADTISEVVFNGIKS